MHHTDTRTVGGERIVLNALHQIKFSSNLRIVNFNSQILILVVINASLIVPRHQLRINDVRI